MDRSRRLAWPERLAASASLPTDTSEERLRKSVLTLFAVLMTALAFVWVVTYWALGLRMPALVPLSYQLVAVTSLVVFLRTKRFRFFRLSQLTLMLVLPTVLQWTLGGFVSSSGVVIWAFAAPLGALMFHGRRQAVPWFVAFASVVALSGVLEVVAPRTVAVPLGVVVPFFVLNVTGIALATFLMLQYFVGERDRAHHALARERERSERLLLNVLPAPIAERLKDESGVIAETHPGVTVLFADVVNFTPLAGRLPAEEVVALLDRIFTTFDALADTQGLEKIKTIGDAYMAAGGLPEPRPDHADAVAEMALGMLEEIRLCAADIGADLSVRVGIESGPVVAGVIGRRKFIYDVWGDTVNTASRMESHGVAGAIQVGPGAASRLRDRYSLRSRGEIGVKGKGRMETYLLLGRLEEDA